MIFSSSDRVIELGGGDQPVFRPNIDIRPGPTVDIVHDLEITPFPIDSGQFDGVYAQFVLEHISWRKVPDFLRECYRILTFDGKAVFVIPNLKQQAKILVDKDDWDFNDICMIFGDQNYSDNTHKAGFSPKMITQLLKEVGFKKVVWGPLPTCNTDMIVVANKGYDTTTDYEIEYFDGGPGAPYDLYLDFPVHWNTVKFIMQRIPESILNIGGARGYVSKHLEELGIPTTNLDISRWCNANRVIKDHIMWDLRVTPYPFSDKQFDMVVSIATLEHISEEYIEDMIREISRISNRSLHGITFEHPVDDVDPTHDKGTLKPREWWIEQFSNIAPDHKVEIVDKEEMECGDPHRNMPPDDGLIKLNLGSYMDMFSYGWKNIDILPLHSNAEHLGCRFTQYDISLKIREKDSSVECVVASHIMEHLDRKQGKKVVNEVFRVLRPGGTFRVATPDLRKICSKYADGSIGDFGIFDKNVRDAEDDAQRLWLVSMAGHRTVYDAVALTNLLENAGFIDIHISEFNSSKSDIIRNQTYDLHPEVSIYIEATKPGEDNE